MKTEKTKQRDDEMIPEEEVFFGGFLLYAFLVFLFVILLFLGVYLKTKWRGKTEMKNTTVLKIFGAAILFSITLLILALFIGYLRDDIFTPSADERSVPPVKTY